MMWFLRILQVFLILDVIVIVRILVVDSWMKLAFHKAKEEGPNFGPWSKAIVHWDLNKWAFNPAYWLVWTHKQFLTRYRKELMA